MGIFHNVCFRIVHKILFRKSGHENDRVRLVKSIQCLPVEIKLDNLVRIDRDSCNTLLVIRVVSWVAWR